MTRFIMKISPRIWEYDPQSMAWCNLQETHGFLFPVGCPPVGVPLIQFLDTGKSHLGISWEVQGDSICIYIYIHNIHIYIYLHTYIHFMKHHGKWFANNRKALFVMTFSLKATIFCWLKW